MVEASDIHVQLFCTLIQCKIHYYDGVVLKIYLDHKFQWPQEGLNCESLAYKVVT